MIGSVLEVVVVVGKYDDDCNAWDTGRDDGRRWDGVIGRPECVIVIYTSSSVNESLS